MSIYQSSRRISGNPAAIAFKLEFAVRRLDNIRFGHDGHALFAVAPRVLEGHANDPLIARAVTAVKSKGKVVGHVYTAAAHDVGAFGILAEKRPVDALAGILTGRTFAISRARRMATLALSMLGQGSPARGVVVGASRMTWHCFSSSSTPSGNTAFSCAARFSIVRPSMTRKTMSPFFALWRQEESSRCAATPGICNG